MEPTNIHNTIERATGFITDSIEAADNPKTVKAYKGSGQKAQLALNDLHLIKTVLESMRGQKIQVLEDSKYELGEICGYAQASATILGALTRGHTHKEAIELSGQQRTLDQLVAGVLNKFMECAEKLHIPQNLGEKLQTAANELSSPAPINHLNAHNNATINNNAGSGTMNYASGNGNNLPGANFAGTVHFGLKGSQ